jgi:hypothetical protein
VSDQEDNYYYNGGWVDTDTEEESMELPEDHPEVSSGSNEGPVGGDGAADKDEDEDGDDDSGAPDGGDDDQMMIQSQPPPQAHHHQSPTMRSRYFTWTLLRGHSPRFSGGPCRGLASL